MLKKSSCEKINELLKGLVDNGKLPGYNLAIVTLDDEYVSTYGYRQLIPEKKPATRDTLYDMASLSKVVSTLTCILKLLEEGKITLQTTIHSIVPEVINEEITVYDCLTHTSGLVPGLPNYKKLNKEQFYDLLYTIQPENDYKGKVRYSDINFIYLGLVINRITGSFKNYAENEIFKPLGMHHTCYMPENREMCAATEDTKDRGLVVGEVHDGTAYRLGGVAGSAGLFSCIDDVIKFVRMVMDDSNDFFSPATREMLRITYESEGADCRTLGWIISNDKSSMGVRYSPHTLFHTGFTGGHILIDLDRKIAEIVLCNRIHPDRNNSSILKYRDVLNTIVYDCLGKE